MAANPGALRFNTDSLKMELFDGNQWVELVATSADSQTGGARGVYGGGYNAAPLSGNSAILDYVTISTTGNTVSFGNLTFGRREVGALASSTRGVWGGGFAPLTAGMDYITISSTGNAITFGNLTVARRQHKGLASATRGVWGGGYAPGANNTIDYITISSTGNAVDFGDLSVLRYGSSQVSSSTRGLFVGGNGPGPTFTGFNTIDFITISTTGNAADFGDTISGASSGSSNATRGVFSGSGNTIEYITIATLGNTVDFGDLTVARSVYTSSSSSTRGLFFSGTTPTYSNVIDYVTIMSIGNAIDFGDVTTTRTLNPAACSNAHGGL